MTCAKWLGILMYSQRFSLLGLCDCLCVWGGGGGGGTFRSKQCQVMTTVQQSSSFACNHVDSNCQVT